MGYRSRSFLLVMALLVACRSREPEPDLSNLYSLSAQSIADERTPVIVIPGIMGSKLDDENGQRLWGAFTFGAVDPDYAEGARQFALPMESGVPLSELRDDVVAVDVLDVLVTDIGPFRGLELGAYVNILSSLAVGRYRDQSLGRAVVDYGGKHYTCYQYPYDWRRDVSESAVALHEFILSAQADVREGRGLATDEPVQVDVVAHSMGGLVLRYYLRYGTAPLPEDGSLPELTWAGAHNVRKAILVGTPSAGSVLALKQLVQGINLHPLFPNYRPSIVGTMPAVYQLMTRNRHAKVLDAASLEPLDLYDVDTWKRYGWGLANGSDMRTLSWLLPDVADRAAREKIALEHIQKCLDRADQFQRALDVPARRPDGLELALFVGDAIDTPGVLLAHADGRLEVHRTEPGDGTVTRQSALMDERTTDTWRAGLRSPVDWSRVQFLFDDHIGLTGNTAFTDNLLFMLLEQPVGDLDRGLHATSP